MSLDELLAWAESHFPMLKWAIVDYFGDTVIMAEIKAWYIRLKVVESDHGNIGFDEERINRYEGHSYYGFADEVERSIRKTIMKLAPELLEDVQMTLF